MSDMTPTAAEDLIEDHLISLTELLTTSPQSFWTWSPFGSDPAAQQEAIDTALMAAECEYARVESVEAKDGVIIVYNDQINFTVPPGTTVPAKLDN